MSRGNQSCVYFEWSVLFESWVLFAWTENFVMRLLFWEVGLAGAVGGVR